MEDCIFCKIIKGEIPSTKVYEDPDFLAFLDINPVNKGHTLLLSKIHVPWMYEAEDVLVSKIFVLAKNLMNKIRLSIPCDYVQIVVMGEEVSHFHIHLIPVYLGKKTAEWKKVEYESHSEMEEYAKRII